MTSSEEYLLPNDQPVIVLDCESAFRLLSVKEKLYAHYLSQASWNGGLIVLLQTSPESPLIFVLLRKLFSDQPISELKSAVLGTGQVTEDEFTSVLVYACGIFTNMGNYKGFGDTKFIPRISEDKFLTVLKCSDVYTRFPKVMQSLWNRCKERMYRLNENDKSINFNNKGTTTYFSSNCTENDSEIVKRYLQHKKIEAYNTRLFKIEDKNKTLYEIRLSSVEMGNQPPITVPEEMFENHCFKVTRGDFSPIMARVIEHLNKAKNYAANDTEVLMLDEFIKSFKTGSIDAHKDGSRYWVQDKAPVIESYIGFIESYRDPSGMRAEFEGFVAMVNKAMSNKFEELVEKSEKFVHLLPWDKGFEIDKFLKPDFTSLDVLSFSGSGIPAGINIPNYSEIKQKEGFKNVSLGNVIHASFKSSKLDFVSEEDKVLIEKHRLGSFEVQVGLHELLGHGSGKLLRKEENGEFNFDVENLINPLTGQKITSWYSVGETYDNKFTSISSSYEECRAECVGLYLCLNPEILKIFGHEGSEADDVVYINWLTMVYAGAGKALEMYHPTSKKWLQAHSQARYVIMRVLLEAGQGFVTINEVDDGKSLYISLDRTKIHTVGKEAISEFLNKLQIYKSTGNFEEAFKMYNKYSEVSESGSHPWAKWRNIVLAHKEPRKMFVQANTSIQGEDVILKNYEASPEGLIQSFMERFKCCDVDTVLEELWESEQMHFN